MIPKKLKQLMDTKPARFVFVPGRTRIFCVHTQFPECVMGITEKGIFHPRFLDAEAGKKLSETYKMSLMIKALQVYIRRMAEELNRGVVLPGWDSVRQYFMHQSS